MSYADEIAADLHANPITLHKLIGKACVEVDSLRAQLAALRRELDEARRDGKRLKALVAALDAYVEFLSRVEGERAGIIVSHPYMAYRAEDIEEGERLRAIIDAARASKP